MPDSSPHRTPGTWSTTSRSCARNDRFAGLAKGVGERKARAVPLLTFLGAAGTVTGSRHLLTTDGGTRVLVDAGLFQGRRELRERNWAPWTAGKLDAVLLTHAHIDHTGY